jgi:hypothetical protein
VTALLRFALTSALGVPLLALATPAKAPPPPATAAAPNQAPAHATEPPGLEAPWDVKAILAALNAQNAKLKPLLDALHPKEWLDNGAPPVYVTQYQDAEARIADTQRAAAALAQRTDSLPLALDTYFRMEALENVTRSVEECVRKYGDRPAADQISALIAQDFNNRQRLRSYLQDLANERDAEFKIADEEAQRCRSIISKEPPPVKRARKIGPK